MDVCSRYCLADHVNFVELIQYISHLELVKSCCMRVNVLAYLDPGVLGSQGCLAHDHTADRGPMLPKGG